MFWVVFLVVESIITFNHKYAPSEEITLPRALARSVTGLGVFATADIPQGTIVEVAPFLIGESIPACLADYHSHPRPEVADYHRLSRRSHILPLGLLALFNHRDDFNVRGYSSKRFYIYETAHNVSKGEELVMSYGGFEWFGMEEQIELPSPSHIDSNLHGSSLYFAPSRVKPRLLGLFTTTPFDPEDEVDICVTIPVSPSLPDWVNCATSILMGDSVLVLGRCSLFMSHKNSRVANVELVEALFEGRPAFKVLARRKLRPHEELILLSQQKPCLVLSAESKFDIYSLVLPHN